MDNMGYHNFERVEELSRLGKISKQTDSGLVYNNFANTVLEFMAYHTYDFPPSQDVKKSGRPCRYYTLGWRAIAEAKGLLLLTAEESMSENADDILKAKEQTTRNRVSRAWKFLKEQKLIKTLVPAALGKNAGFLLLIGDNDENYECEKYARERLGLPYPSVEELRAEYGTGRTF